MTFSKSGIGISAVAAAMIFTGCGSSSSGGGGSDSTPAALKEKVEVNETIASTVMMMLPEVTSMGPLSKVKTAVDAIKVELKDGSETHQDDLYDCDISGTYRYQYDREEVDQADGTYLYEYTSKTTYNDCVDNGSSTYNDGTVSGTYNTETWDGIYSYGRREAYDPDANVSTNTYWGHDNYSYTYEDNVTGYTRTYTYQNTYESTDTLEGYFLRAAPTNYTYTMKLNGLYSRYDRDGNGSAYDGYKDEYKNLTSRETGTPTSETTTINGSYVYYDINASGEYMYEGFYFSNFVDEMSEVGDERNASVSGVVGSLCLGGAVTLETTQTIQMNDVAYSNTCSGDPEDTLPYAGVLKVTSTGTVTATSQNDGTYTSVTMTGDDINVTYDCWSEVEDAAADCAIGE